MTLNLWPLGQRRACPRGEHSWVIHQFRGSASYRDLEICEHCGRTQVLLSGDRTPERTPVHAAMNPAA